jgi:hypothetical protein
MKVYGFKSLLFFTIALIILTTVVWSVDMLLVSIGVLAFWTQVGVPIIKISSDKIVLQSLSLFRKTLTIDLDKITKLEYNVGGSRSGPGKITIATAEKTYKTLFFLSGWETKGLYKHLVKLKITVESKGSEAYDWNP